MCLGPELLAISCCALCIGAAATLADLAVTLEPGLFFCAFINSILVSVDLITLIALVQLSLR